MAAPTADDLRADVIGVLDLIEIAAPDGVHRFMAATDGVFVDVTGRKWYGSSLLAISRMQAAIGGIAPEGALTLSWFQDPSTPDLVEQMRAHGPDYLSGAPIRFFVQILRSQAEFQAPVVAPWQWCARVIRQVSYQTVGAHERSISVGFESWGEDRRAARRIALNTEGHARLIGRENPSLEFMPPDNFEEENLLG